jgi:hypothetical protein
MRSRIAEIAVVVLNHSAVYPNVSVESRRRLIGHRAGWETHDRSRHRGSSGNGHRRPVALSGRFRQRQRDSGFIGGTGRQQE